MCRAIADKEKYLNINNLPRVTEKMMSAANDSVTVSVLEETSFLLFFSNCSMKSSNESGILICCFEYSKIF